MAFSLATHLLLAYLKYSSLASVSMQQLLRLLQVNLFMRRDLFALLRGDPAEEEQISLQMQLALG